jgi:hypothetical protein
MSFEGRLVRVEALNGKIRNFCVSLRQCDKRVTTRRSAPRYISSSSIIRELDVLTIQEFIAPTCSGSRADGTQGSDRLMSGGTLLADCPRDIFKWLGRFICRGTNHSYQSLSRGEYCTRIVCGLGRHHSGEAGTREHGPSAAPTLGGDTNSGWRSPQGLRAMWCDHRGRRVLYTGCAGAVARDGR